MTSRNSPTHSLEAIQTAVRTDETFIITDKAARTAWSIPLDKEDIRACVLGLGPGDFYKSMESRKRAGLWQDVYKTRYAGYAIYTKLQLTHRGAVAVVISFKIDESP